VEADVSASHQAVEQVGVEDAVEDELDVIFVLQILDVLARPLLRLSSRLTVLLPASSTSMR
jgi:hypothetical protein